MMTQADTDDDAVVRAIEEASEETDGFFAFGSPNAAPKNQDNTGPNSGLTEEETVFVRKELEKTESEIETLRGVLAARLARAAELKHQLGITPWQEMSHDISNTVDNIKHSEAYERSQEVLHNITDKTNAVLSTVGGKLTQVRESQPFRKFEDIVGSAYSTAKVGASASMEFLSGRTKPDSLEDLTKIDESKESADNSSGPSKQHQSPPM
jgi:hypothetical protein